MDTCFHCGDSLPTGQSWSISIQGVLHPVCCPACQAVANTIINMGCDAYYEKRDIPNTQTRAIANTTQPNPDSLQAFVTDEANQHEIYLAVEGIHCTACVWLIEKSLQTFEQPLDVRVQLPLQRVRVRWRGQREFVSTIYERLASLGYRIKPLHSHERLEPLLQEKRTLMRRLALSGLITMQVMMFSVGLYMGDYYGIAHEHRDFLRWVSMALCVPLLLYGARPFFLNAFIAIRQRAVTMDSTVSLALILAFIASVYGTWQQTAHVYFDSVGMFIFFLLISRFIEISLRYRNLAFAEGGMRLDDPFAHKMNQNGNTEDIGIAEINIGDTLLIKPGEQVPTDLKLLSQQAGLQETQITGEFASISKFKNDIVFAGSVNTGDAFEGCAITTAKASRLGQLQQLVEDVQSEQFTAQKINSEHLAKYFVVIVLGVATMTALAWLYLGNANWLENAIAVLIVACPCALSLARPATVSAAVSRLLSQGILIKRAESLFRVSDASNIVFDKTGTLTIDRFDIVKTECHNSMSPDAAFAIAAGLEHQSEHPIAKAFQCNDRVAMHSVRNVIGQGLLGSDENATYRIGSASFCGVPESNNAGDMLPIYLTRNEKHIATFYLTVPLRTGTQAFISYCQRMGLRTAIYTGDPSSHGPRLASHLNIQNVAAGLSPTDKLERIRHDKQAGVTIMVGDGINDAAALTAADVSISVANGTSLSQNQADVILLKESLAPLSELFLTSRKMLAIIKQNQRWALFYNFSMLPLAALGLIPPWFAAIGMSASSLLVVLNAMRLNRSNANAQSLPLNSARLTPAQS